MKRLSRRNSLAFLALALISFQLIIVLSSNIQLVAASPKTLVVPTNYATIADAVGNASQGDTILVKSGTYYENVFINKSVTILGEDSTNTIIIGKGGAPNTYVFYVTADNVKISGFTIESVNYSVSTPKLFAGGIAIAGNNCTVTGNNIVNVYRGIYVGGWGNITGTVSQTNIVGNNIIGAINDGIMVYGGGGNVISDNNLISNNGSAIVLTGYSSAVLNNNLEYNQKGIGSSAAYSVIFKNNITNSAYWGIYFEGSNNVVVANYIANNRWGVYLSPAFPPENNTFYHNDFVNNIKQVNIGSPDTVQIWDNGYPSGGNYWSNYTGVDLMSGPNQNQPGKDGIGDTPMIIGVNNTDYYPLMAPFDISSATLPCACQPSPIQNNTVAYWQFDTVAPDGSTPDSTGNNPIIFGNYHTLVIPNLVLGKFGQALNVSFDSFGMAFASQSLDVSGAITISVWVKITSFENTTYNNIFVQSAGTLNKYLARVYGLALNGLSPSNATSGPLGAVCGYVTTTSGFNEIVTLTPAVQLNQWTNIVFTRSLTTGMHIYVNGVEQPVMVTSGSQDPTGNIVTGNELYLGHDFSGDISELRISDAAEVPQSNAGFQALGLQWWAWLAITAAVVAILVGALYVRNRSKKTSLP